MSDAGKSEGIPGEADLIFDWNTQEKVSPPEIVQFDDETLRDGLQSPIVKFLPDEVLTAIIEKTSTESGDILFFGAGETKVVNESIGALRVKLGHDERFVVTRGDAVPELYVYLPIGVLRLRVGWESDFGEDFEAHVARGEIALEF